jgi:hypothetical protein
MSITYRGELARGSSVVSGAVPGATSAPAAFQTYDDGALTNDAVFVYGNAPGALFQLTTPSSVILSPTQIIGQNGPASDDGLVASQARQRIAAGDAIATGPGSGAWSWSAVAFAGLRAFQSNPGPAWDLLVPYASQHRDGKPVGAQSVVFDPVPTQYQTTLALLFVAYDGPNSAGKVDTPAGWTALPEVTGGAPGETQRIVIGFYRLVDDCSPVSPGLMVRPAGDGAQFYASLILLGLAVSTGPQNTFTASLCAAAAAEPGLAHPSTGTKRGWNTVDFAFLSGKALVSLACPRAANDNYARLWHTRWSGDYPPVPEAPVEIIGEGVMDAALLASGDARQAAFYRMATEAHLLHYRLTEDGGRTWGGEQTVDPGLNPIVGTLPAGAPAYSLIPLCLLPTGLLIVGMDGIDTASGAGGGWLVVLKRNEATGQWAYAGKGSAVDPVRLSPLGGSGNPYQMLRDRTVMRASAALLRLSGIQEDGSVLRVDLRTPSPGFPAPPVNLAGHTVAWINERNGLLLTMRPSDPLMVGGPLWPAVLYWNVYKLNADELYDLTGNGANVGVNIGDVRPWEAPTVFVWDPDALLPYGGGVNSYLNHTARLKTDDAGLWWLLRPCPDGALRFARGRRLSDWGTMDWEGR